MRLTWKLETASRPTDNILKPWSTIERPWISKRLIKPLWKSLKCTSSKNNTNDPFKTINWPWNSFPNNISSMKKKRKSWSVWPKTCSFFKSSITPFLPWNPFSSHKNPKKSTRCSDKVTLANNNTRLPSSSIKRPTISRKKTIFKFSKDSPSVLTKSKSIQPRKRSTKRYCKLTLKTSSVWTTTPTSYLLSETLIKPFTGTKWCFSHVLKTYKSE